ncbi:uncharacterized protein TNCV_4235111 [Trichonephila clavipes]|nr:uncharacterized protein TNCV_4235111 [Trichonephila clavipes]
MAPHIITPAVGVVCRCKNAGLRHSPRVLHANTIVITAEIESGFVAIDDLVPLHCSPVSSCHSKRMRRRVGIKGSTHNGSRDPNCPSAKRLRMVREDTGASSEDATCARIAADEAVGCTRAFLMMWRSSQPTVC